MDIIASLQHGLIEKLNEEVAALAGRRRQKGRQACDREEDAVALAA